METVFLLLFFLQGKLFSKLASFSLCPRFPLAHVNKELKRAGGVGEEACLAQIGFQYCPFLLAPLLSSCCCLSKQRKFFGYRVSAHSLKAETLLRKQKILNN